MPSLRPGKSRAVLIDIEVNAALADERLDHSGALFESWVRDLDALAEPREHRRVHELRMVRGRQHEDVAGLLLDAVHLREQLVDDFTA